MTRPLIQIDDLVREMTDDEYDLYLTRLENTSANGDSTYDASEPA